MKTKSTYLIIVAILGLLSNNIYSQTPNYVPTNGLVGWWPFNSNANDESGNGNNGTVNGASLTTDRFGNSNSAYNFNGSSSYIQVSSNSNLQLTNNYSINGWFNADVFFYTNNSDRSIISKVQSTGWYGGYEVMVGGNTNDIAHTGNVGGNNFILGSTGYSINTWYMFTTTYDGNSMKLYMNGVLVSSQPTTGSLQTSGQPLFFGRRDGGIQGYFDGKIDDIGIWNQALTQQEITDLYNAVNCANNTAITPQTNSLATGNTATFAASTTDPNPSYVWQSDLGQGFQTLNNFGNYSGTNTANLNIANVQLANHNQPIRVISTSGNCIDTSNVAVINILDTCLVTVYDTLLTTVTDTLVINTQITGINPPNNLNTLKVFPNPASTHITIDYGNFSAMSGYTLTIVNSVGQTVFTTPINQQTSYIDLSTWTGNGIYFVQLIDPQNNTIENRKIVIQ